MGADVMRHCPPGLRLYAGGYSWVGDDEGHDASPTRLLIKKDASDRCDFAIHQGHG